MAPPPPHHLQIPTQVSELLSLQDPMSRYHLGENKLLWLDQKMEISQTGLEKGQEQYLT